MSDTTDAPEAKKYLPWGALDTSAFKPEAGETEYVAEDGTIWVSMFWVAGLSKLAEGGEAVVALTPLLPTMNLALAAKAELDPTHPGIAVLWIRRFVHPDSPAGMEWLKQHRETRAKIGATILQ